MPFPFVLGASGPIDTKTAATTAVQTIMGARRFYPLFAVFEITAQSGTIGTPAAVSLGTNATVDDVLAITTLTGLTALNKMLTVLSATAGSVAPGATISVKVTTVAVGIGATQSFKVVIVGFYD